MDRLRAPSLAEEGMGLGHGHWVRKSLEKGTVYGNRKGNWLKPQQCAAVWVPRLRRSHGTPGQATIMMDANPALPGWADV
jgi:hypothetical protein